MKKTPPTLKEAKFLPKKLTNKNAHEKVSTAIKDLKKIKRTPRATGLWWDKIKIETTKGKPVYPVSYDVGKWCMDRDFPLPKNEEEENRILWLFDYRFYILKRELKNFINDILDILVAERAILFYLGVAIGIILGFCGYHYYF